MKIPLWLREIGHAIIWFLPVPVAVYFCDSWSVSVASTFAVRWGVWISWTILTLLTEMMELAEGREDRRKYYLDKMVKLSAAFAGLLIAGFWRELA